jgi:hypothetical protein
VRFDPDRPSACPDGRGGGAYGHIRLVSLAGGGRGHQPKWHISAGGFVNGPERGVHRVPGSVDADNYRSRGELFGHHVLLSPDWLMST